MTKSLQQYCISFFLFLLIDPYSNNTDCCWSLKENYTCMHNLPLKQQVFSNTALTQQFCLSKDVVQYQ